MQFNAKFAVFALLMVSLLASCKYEEGPLVSLQSRVKRVAGDWEVAYSTDSNGEEDTDTYEDWTFSFREDFSAKIETGGQVSIEILGDWDFSQDDTVFQLEDMEFPLGIPAPDGEYDIERLTQDEFWLRDRADTAAVIQLRAIEVQ
jgi:hypothetical protein